MNEITVSIVAYRSPEEQLRAAVMSALGSPSVRKLYLVDNSPGPAPWPWLNDPRIAYSHNGRNLGFGRAHNIALRRAIHESPFVLILNPDVTFDPSILETLVGYMNEHDEVGALMPLVRYPNGDIQHLAKLLPTPLGLALRRFLPIAAVRARHAARYELRFTGYRREMVVPTISGCFLLARSDVLTTTGLFDERYFMYLDDVDLTRRIGRVSKIVFTPSCEITHSYEKSSYRNILSLFYHVTSAVKYFNKWGWFRDPDRLRVNRETLERLGFAAAKRRGSALQPGCLAGRGTSGYAAPPGKATKGSRRS